MKNYIDKDGERQGLWEWFSDNGKIQVRGNYVDGKEQGLHEWFSDNGKIQERGNYRNGLKEGEQVEYIY